MLTCFKYLGRVISVADDECPAAVKKLAKALVVWRRLTQILRREGAGPRLSGFFFKDVVHLVLIFGA